jgi:pimeloyl-ACP methyl ester carboxylesterase
MKKLIQKAIPKTVGALLNASSLFNSKYAAAKALALFATPRKGLIKPHQQAYLDNAETVALDYQGYKIMTYHWQGAGKKVLLCHGWESNAHRWKKLISLLQADSYNIIAIDAPAHGNSESKRFNAVLYSEFINVVCQNFNPEIIIGHSVGGMASVFFQSKYQFKTLQKMVLMGAPSEFKTILENYINLLGYNKKVVKKLELLIEATFGRKPEAFSTAKFGETINVNTLIIHDTKDAIIPYADAELIHNSMKNSQLIKTEGFGHSLNHSSIYQHIIDFLNH